ncbi:hypothetical protein NGM99_10980 [Mesorhizobium sp. RP14(2022)]|uniref:Uncharacterized protein n=1 Tax=Mesorhizobium liriopis TaxID=2953882 RepID=A0ABT1C653_9HYPH|nr:hypothetical protein [Mesorhizobium liriopis]MCO6050307.1 hypothetical protein [Mesorhizobium liriopis]
MKTTSTSLSGAELSASALSGIDHHRIRKIIVVSEDAGCVCEEHEGRTGLVGRDLAIHGFGTCAGGFDEQRASAGRVPLIQEFECLTDVRDVFWIAESD